MHQLAGYLTEENHAEVLRRAKHRSMREIEHLIAEISPKPDARALVRALPGLQAQDLAARVTPLSPRRYKLQVTIGQEARDALAELQNLSSHQIPNGSLGDLIEYALKILLEKTRKRKAALTKARRAAPHEKQQGNAPPEASQAQPANGAAADRPVADAKRVCRDNGRMTPRRTRTIPAHVRRQVFERDGGRCAFVSDDGKRCNSAWQLEFHHCVPYARDGPHTVENIELRCRAHNLYEAELEYGRRFMAARCGDASRG